jgi:putative acetyltransferase
MVQTEKRSTDQGRPQLHTVRIRREAEADYEAVRTVYAAAFSQPVEAAIVDALRGSAEAISLVAEEGDRIIGHILFTAVSIESPSGRSAGLALGPMAVAPEFQKRGVGSALVRDGLAHIKEMGCPFVTVLGHAGFYPRFGFVPASRFGIDSQWEGVPDDAFMIAVLDRTALPAAGGVAYHRPEFGEATGDDDSEPA